MLGLGCAKDGAPNSDSFDLSRNPNRTKRSTYFKKFLRVPSVLDMILNILNLNNFLVQSILYLFLGAKWSIKSSSSFYNSLSNSLSCVSVKFWH